MATGTPVDPVVRMSHGLFRSQRLSELTIFSTSRKIEMYASAYRLYLLKRPVRTVSRRRTGQHLLQESISEVKRQKGAGRPVTTVASATLWPLKGTTLRCNGHCRVHDVIMTGQAGAFAPSVVETTERCIFIYEPPTTAR